MLYFAFTLFGGGEGSFFDDVVCFDFFTGFFCAEIVPTLNKTNNNTYVIF